MSLLGKESIFDHNGVDMDIDPTKIRLLSDRVLVRDLGDPERDGSIIIPEIARDKARDEWGVLRIGLVLAVGPGDQFLEHGVTDEGQVRRSLITKPCEFCEGKGKYFAFKEYETITCEVCHGEKVVPVTIPPQCQPGDKILYTRRKEAEIYINGERLSIVHGEQSVLALLEDE